MRKTLLYIAIWMMAIGLQAQSMVYLEYCETLSFDERRLPDAQLLRGNVRFRHEDALMFCDSAYFFQNTNSVTAMGHVRFEQGDTLHGFGDRLYYDGNRKLARLCQHVQLIHMSTTLTTDSLNYDRILDKAYYFTGGKIQDSLNVLTSVWGEYCPTTHNAFFKKEVQLGNESFTLTSDSLIYNTQTHLASLISPTLIVYQGETSIQSSKGWYNTESEQSMLLDRSVIAHVDGKTLTGDTIYYDKKRGIGELIRHIETVDSAQHITLHGNYSYLWEKDRRGFVTDSALLEDWSQDKHTYLHADTIFTEEVVWKDAASEDGESKNMVSKDTVSSDTVSRDTTYRQFRAKHHVRAYNEDYQLACDSLTYNGKDSTVILYHLPVCWSDSNQISADSITVYIENGSVSRVRGVGSALGIKRESADYFDQMSGKEMMAYLENGELKKVDVIGNAETIFYPQDDDEEFIGVNKTQSSLVQIFFEDSRIHHVLFTTETTGTMYPLDQIDSRDTFFPTFFWAEEERPLSMEDVFRHQARAARPTQASVSAIEDEEEEPQKDKQKTTIRNKKRK